MITRGASDLPRAPTSPSSRANITPSVVSLNLHRPLRKDRSSPMCKRAPAKPLTGTALAEARKGKKKLVKRTAAGSLATPSKKPTGDGERASESDTQDTPVSPPSADASAAAKLSAATTKRSDGGFDLGAFMASFEPGVAGAGTVPAAESRTSAAAPDQDTADMAAQLYALKAEQVQQLRALTAHQAPAPVPRAKRQEVIVTHLKHLLAASRMFRSFGTETESSEVATLEDGSTNSNFSSDFSPSANLPAAMLQCASYEDILEALHGLNAFGQEVWYDHMRKLVSRLRSFVGNNKSADPANTPARVRRTLLYSNKFLGAALGHMQTDDPQWWSGFCETLLGIDYLSPVWTLALVSALTQVKSNGGRHGAARSTGDFGRRDTMRRPAISESMRRLIPINRKGQEPCLLNWFGRMYGARGQAEDGRQ
ncbi:hypothetical protein JG688_00006249 [Phytophthora aleatoria]|uniref:Uncharacterized protein n=1 Tax=Phytophthora aleatoria TaxID=2496075 RepID=A0A8J5ILK1_9STRA|nr:hypothetical protein JG688_00006249 [Phytophthora aleatoria]